MMAERRDQEQENVMHENQNCVMNFEKQSHETGVKEKQVEQWEMKQKSSTRDEKWTIKEQWGHLRVSG